jgi:hypothetical protein
MILKEDEEFLEHFGVKGMKWGVRKERKADASWKRNVTKNWYKAHNAAADQANASGGLIDRLNNSKKYKNKNLNKDPKLLDEYLKTYDHEFNKLLDKTMRSQFGTSPSGKFEAKMSVVDGVYTVYTKPITVKHDDLTTGWIKAPIKVVIDSLGHILRLIMEPETKSLAMSSLSDEEFLEHFGVKGMHWDVRRNIRAQRLTRYGRGKGSARDVLTVGNSFVNDILFGYGARTGYDLVKVHKTNKRLSEVRQLKRNKRVQSGKGSTKDLLVYYGSTRLGDLIPSRESTYKKTVKETKRLKV